MGMDDRKPRRPRRPRSLNIALTDEEIAEWGRVALAADVSLAQLIRLAMRELLQRGDGADAVRRRVFATVVGRLQ